MKKLTNYTEFKLTEYENLNEGLKEDYQAFFKKKLEKFGVGSPAELKGDDIKKFFNEIKDEWPTEKAKLLKK